MIDNVPKLDDPVLFDLAIEQIQDALKLNLIWLNFSFGKSQTLIKKRDGKAYKYPAVHVGKGEYVDVFPSTDYRNHSFFILHDPQEISDFKPRSYNLIEAKVSIIIWFDFDCVEISDDRRLENIKAQVLEVLTKKLRMTYGRFTFSNFEENSKNIYREYSIDEIESQYLMQPYSAIRVNGNLKIPETCSL